jgi:cell division protein FtsB
MAGFGKKKSITEYLYSKAVVIVLLVVVIFLAFAVYERYVVERQMYARRVETNREKQELIDRKGTLKERVEYLSGDRGIEEEIRSNFDVAKEDEKVIILVGEKKKAEATTTSIIDAKPWYKFWQ